MKKYDHKSSFSEKMNLGIPDNDPFVKWVNRIALGSLIVWVIIQIVKTL